MRKIVHKVFLGISLLILLVVIIAIGLNTFFLEKFYVSKKIKSLATVATELAETGLTNDLSVRLKTTDNVFVQEITLQSGTFYDYEIQNGLLSEVSRVTESSLEKKGSAILFQTIGANRYVMYFKKVTDKKYYILRTSVDSIQQEVKIANEFLIYSGILILLIGFIMSYFFSKRLTSPILKINESIQKIATMDFSQKLEIATNDELELLASNINKLSQDLEEKIQALKIANAKLKDDIDKEKQLENMKNEFISNISHEIKTPITVINTYAEVIMEDMVPDEKTRSEYSQVIIDEGIKISKLLDDLSSYLKVGNIGFDIKKEIFDLQDLIERNLKNYQLDILEKGIDLKFTPLKIKQLVEGDKFRIDQVLTNFLSNAISHVDTQGQITVGLYTKADRIVVEIENSGSHIADEYIENIWKPFFKIDKSRNRKYGGTGLGLAIVKNILEKSDSKFGVFNTDTGVKFWFDITVKAKERKNLKR